MKIKNMKLDEIRGFMNKEWKKYDASIGVKWNEKTYAFCALEEGIIGCVTCIINGDICYVDEFIVAENARRRGVGAKLWKKVEDFAKKKKCFKIAIKTPEKNKSAINFYKKQGLKVDAVLKDYWFHLKWYYMSKKVK